MNRGKSLVLTLSITLICGLFLGSCGNPGLTEAQQTPFATHFLGMEATQTSAKALTPRPTKAPATPTKTEDEMLLQDSVWGEISWDDYSIYEAGLIQEARGKIAELSEASVYHVDIQISDDLLKLEGNLAVRYTNQEDVALGEVYFQLFPNAAGGSSQIHKVTVDGTPVEAQYTAARQAARVHLPALLLPNKQTTIEMEFEVDVPEELGGNFGTFGYFDEVLVLDEFYPVIPVYDEAGWNYEIPQMGDLTYLDASFYLVRVTAPKSLVMVASGSQVALEDIGDQQRATYAAGPARDFYLAGSELFTVTSEQTGETMVNSYAFSYRKEGAAKALEAGINALRSFNERFGVYPYREMDLVSTPLMALGIEYPGIMGITLDLYDLTQELFGAPTDVILESTVVHEVGHQYFYNVVGNNQIGQPWLDEAVVQYVTGLYYRDQYGSGGYQGYRNSWYDRWDNVDRELIPIGLPSEAYDPKEYGAIVYGRGPLFLDALEAQIGTEIMDEFLRAYYQEHRWEIGNSEVFKEMAEEQCACDLTTLFEEWVYERP